MRNNSVDIYRKYWQGPVQTQLYLYLRVRTVLVIVNHTSKVRSVSSVLVSPCHLISNNGLYFIVITDPEARRDPAIKIPFPETLTCECSSFTGYSVGRWEEPSGLGQGQLQQGNYGQGGEVRQHRLHPAHAVHPHQVLLSEAEDGGGQEWEDLHGVVGQDQVPQIQQLRGREVARESSHDPPGRNIVLRMWKIKCKLTWRQSLLVESHNISDVTTDLWKKNTNVSINIVKYPFLLEKPLLVTYPVHASSEYSQREHRDWGLTGGGRTPGGVWTRTSDRAPWRWRRAVQARGSHSTSGQQTWRNRGREWPRLAGRWPCCPRRRSSLSTRPWLGWLNRRRKSRPPDRTE